MKVIKGKYSLAIICTLIPLVIQIFWYFSFQKFRNQEERIEYFMSVFYPITNTYLILGVNMILCLVPIILSGLLLKEATGIKKSILVILLILSIILLLIYLLQMQV